MSKKRRKSHERPKQEQRNKTVSKSISTMADVIPAELLKNVKQELSGKASTKTPNRPSTPATHSTTRHQGSNKSLKAELLAQFRRGDTSSVKESSSSPKQKTSYQATPKSHGPSLAAISAKTVLRPGRSMRKTTEKPSNELRDLRLHLDSAESKEKRSRHRELIVNSLNRFKSDALDINLGIDLGTSFSKVVWRGTDKAYPICFGDDSAKLGDYFVPSVVIFDGQSIHTSLTKGVDLTSKDAIPNFKMCLACQSRGGEDCQPTSCPLSNWGRALNSLPEPVLLMSAIFIAQLIYRSRELVRKQLKALGVKGTAIRWSANLAVPEKYMDDSPTLTSFKHVLRTSWLIAEILDQNPELSKAEDVLDAYAAAKEIAESGEELDCFVYPEVAAEVASVTKSRRAKQGLYAFVDVGAGTVDGSVFRFHRLKDDPSQVTYAASVITAGAARVEIDASENLAELARIWFKNIKEDGAGIAGLTVTPQSILSPPLREALNELEAEVREQLIGLFKEAHSKEPGEFKWGDLQLIIGGGGSALPTYVSASREAFTLKGSRRGGNLKEVPLDAPFDFEMGRLAKTAFHRFAVAYGLSFHHVNLPGVVLAKEVNPPPPEEPSTTLGYLLLDD